jgi:predicted amidohydrolase
MMTTVRVAAAQTPEFIDDIDASLNYATQVIEKACDHGARLVCFPECFLQGYLLDAPKARQAALDLSSSEFQSILARLPQTNVTVTLGLIEKSSSGLFNTAVVVQNGVLKGLYRKTHLLRSESFFTPGTETRMFSVDDLKFGVNICYDTNFPEMATAIAKQGGALMVCLSNNMMPRESAERYRNIHNAVRPHRCREQGIWLVSSDIFGERDGQVSWGPTAVIDPSGHVVAQLPLGQSGLLVFDIPMTPCA